MKSLLILSTLFLLSAGPLIYSQSAFTVNTTDDTPPYDNPDTEIDEADDGICADQNGHCSLRAAMLETNGGGNSFPRTITINIPGQINLKKELGLITIIDGFKLIGNRSTTIDGTATSGAFLISGSDVVVDGLVVKAAQATALGINFGSNIQIKNSFFKDSNWGLSTGGFGASNVEISDNTISGNTVGLIFSGFGYSNIKVIKNKIGTDPSGNSALPNLQAGISIPYSLTGTPQIIIGGDDISERNIISGNSNYGIQVQSDNVVIKNNYIGTDFYGTTAIPNENNGIVLNSSNNSVYDNVISGNKLYGIMLHNNVSTVSSANKIYGNIIGGRANDTLPLPNGVGIWIEGNSQNNIIGNGLSAVFTPNAIVHNTGKGIVIDNSFPTTMPSKNTFRKNMIKENGSTGIQVKSGTQNNIQPPILDSLSKLSTGDIHLYGHGAAPNALVDLYYADDEPTNSGEGKMWLKQINADGLGNFNFIIDSPTCEEFTVMQTDPQGNSSQFSNNLNPKPKSNSAELNCSGVFLTGVSYLNEFKLNMDWKGMPPANRKVDFYLNGANKQEGQIIDDVAKTTYDMSLLQTGDNKITWQIYDCDGSTFTEPPYSICAVTLPFWLPTPTAVCNSGTINYEKRLTFPDNVVQSFLQIPPNVDFISGMINFLGAPKYETTLKIPGHSPTVTFTSSFSLMGFSLRLRATGDVEVNLDCSSITPQGNLSLRARASKTFYAGYNLGSYLPSCTGVLSWPILNEGCEKLHQLARNFRVGCKVGGNLDLNARVTLNNGLSLQGSSANIKFYAKPFIDLLFLHARGNGNINFAIDIPSFDLQNLYGSLSGKIYCDFPVPMFQFTKDLGPWTFLRSSEELYLKNINASDFALKEIFGNGKFYTALTSPLEIKDTTIIQNIPSDGNISVAIGDNGRKAVAWVEMNDQSRPSGNISVKLFNGSTWLNNLLLNNDINSDISPVIAFDNNNNLIVCWTRNGSATNPDPVNFYDPAYLKQFEVVSAVINSENGNIVSSNLFATPNEYDFNPKLIKGKDGSINLIWQTGDGTTLFGKPNSRLAFKKVLWSGGSWSGIETIASDFEGIMSWDYSALNASNGFLSYSKDLDLSHLTSLDLEIFIKKLQNNNWLQPQQITTDNNYDIAVHSSYSSDCRPILSWLRDSLVVGLVDNFTSAPTVWFDSTRRGLEYEDAEIIATNDTILAAWQEAGAVYYSYSNINKMNWSEPFLIGLTEMAQTNINLASDTKGDILLGCLQYPNIDSILTSPINGDVYLYQFNLNQPPTVIEHEAVNIPAEYVLYDPYPNPFNNQTKIKISIPVAGKINLVIYDLLGKQVAEIHNGMLNSGFHEFDFNSSGISSGVYIIRLTTDYSHSSKKLILLK